jgi:hypothetical protein
MWTKNFFSRSRGGACAGFGAAAVAVAMMIRTIDHRDLPSRGRFWIESDTGRVLISELVARNRQVRGTVDVSYQSEPLLGLLVPIEMRERYDDHHGARIEAIATYGRFRQFQVKVDETFLIR